jgi:hypothetical protein
MENVASGSGDKILLRLRLLVRALAVAHERVRWQSAMPGKSQGHLQMAEKKSLWRDDPQDRPIWDEDNLLMPALLKGKFGLISIGPSFDTGMT